MWTILNSLELGFFNNLARPGPDHPSVHNGRKAVKTFQPFNRCDPFKSFEFTESVPGVSVSLNVIVLA